MKSSSSLSGCLALMVAFLIPLFARAEDAIIPTAPKPSAPLVFSGSNSKIKAAWQEHYTLGPNDVIGFSFYGHPELARPNVVIAPDGRVNYLQALGVMAAGKTIDELREVVTTELSRYYVRPRVIITPGELRSKKFYILGKVINKGAFTLERPMTVIEAVAQAGGLETGIFQLNTVELADLPRSFLIRNHQRVPIDLDRLFRHGDLTQNILIEPDDYLYFPSSVNNEIYVLGAVGSPGAQGLSVDASVLGSITLAGGFTDNAFRQRVLVVRGSLENPERFIVNIKDVLAGKVPDFRLLPRDLVYVSKRPWVRVEDLADLAVTSFIQTVVTTWTGRNIGPLITSPVVPGIK